MSDAGCGCTVLTADPNSLTIDSGSYNGIREHQHLSFVCGTVLWRSGAPFLRLFACGARLFGIAGGLSSGTFHASERVKSSILHNSYKNLVLMVRCIEL